MWSPWELPRLLYADSKRVGASFRRRAAGDEKKRRVENAHAYVCCETKLMLRLRLVAMCLLRHAACASRKAIRVLAS